MLMAVDIGNTNITIAIFDEEEIVGHYRLTTKFQRTSDEYGFMILSFLQASNIQIDKIKDIILSSVVPKINYSFVNSLKKYLLKTPIIIGPGIKTGISIKIDDPKTLGADRLVDAAGAFNLYGGPCIVIDFGTATTFDVINEKGEFLGGTTAPGINICNNALSLQAAKLPEVAIEKPPFAIAKNTVDSMQAGIVFGYIGLTDHIIKVIKKEYGQDMKVISTGGLGRLIYNESSYIDVYDPDLTFKGLKYIYDKNIALKNTFN
ncbi:type III pantothenate kinase [Tannockella kyphosi]|uniref:type III pantothenate kinase n=1 Tax=Tannockella kyphosi TaxID=2899121 RepID=UPI0020121BDF|nr:type III pantothenate kinase [Tannockella kyphosi]